MKYSRLIGALFLSAFFFYGIGLALVVSVVGAREFLTTISAHQTTLLAGAFLMFLNSIVVVSLGVLFFPVVENHGRRTALAYLAARIAEGVLLAVGVLCILMTVPLGQHATEDWAKGVAALLVQSNTMAYQLAVISLGLGSIVLCRLLFRTRLIPRWLAAWGLIGYAIFMSGGIVEIFGLHIGVWLSIPGGLFEVAVGLWLLIRGFRSEAIANG